MKCYKYFLSSILLLMSTFVYSQGTFQVIESNGQYTYIERKRLRDYVSSV